jgi:malate dehydrogenase
MSRSDLLEVNGKVMQSVAEYIRAGSPEAVVIVVTNPLDSMVTLMRHCLAFPSRRVIGMAGVLDAARYSWFISEATGAAVQDVDAMVLGAHGDSMVPMPDRCTVNGIGVLDLVDRDAVEAMGERTKTGGGEIVKLLKTGSAWYAPASASVAMAASVLRDERRMMPCACLLNGEYGLENLYMGVPAILGRGGVERIVELPLRTESRALLQKTAGAIHEDVLAMRDLGLF